MACDLQFTNANTGGKWKGKTKIYKMECPFICGQPFVVGFAGGANDMLTIIDFFENYNPEVKPRRLSIGANSGGLILTQDGTIYRFSDPTKWILVCEPYAAIGSGMDYALGAMASGKTPKEAVKIASKHDSYTGLGVKVLSF